MKSLLPATDLFLECRDYRVPLVSRNPLFEEHLAGKKRIIIYTKHDLGGIDETKSRRRILSKWEEPTPVVFSNNKPKDSRKLLQLIRRHAVSNDRLTGPRMMIIGMPNVGKSTLLNVLRQVGVGRGKVAKTGAQPGVTRGIGTSVKILEGKDESQQVYMLDTPGVFVPYVPDPESMLKLALCGSVKDTIISPVIIADYLLFRINLVDPYFYKHYSKPTNEITTLLDAMARKTGRLQKFAVPDMEAAALWMIQRWRNGQLGTFILDEVTKENLAAHEENWKNMEGSVNQARKGARDAQRQRMKEQQLNT